MERKVVEKIKINKVNKNKKAMRIKTEKRGK